MQPNVTGMMQSIYSGIRGRANADHLFGLAAECALKAVMQALGMLSLRSDGVPADKKHKVHINDLWNEFITFANTPHRRTLRCIPVCIQSFS